MQRNPNLVSGRPLLYIVFHWYLGSFNDGGLDATSEITRMKAGSNSDPDVLRFYTSQSSGSSY